MGAPAHGDGVRLGRVGTLYRYPVKSMLGEALARAALSERGIAGDREVGIIDVETGRVASAKNPRLWARLLQCRAAAADGTIRIRLPGGERLNIDEAGSEALSRFIGRPVRLVRVPPADATLERANPDEVLDKGTASPVSTAFTKIGAGAPPGTFFDFAPLHLMASSTLEAIAREVQQPVDAARYRPNILIDVAPGTAPFTENDWAGRRLRVGRAVLQLVVPTPRCAVPTLAHGALAPLPEALRAVVRLNRVPVLTLGKLPCLGVYAQVVEAGPVAAGDTVELLG